MIDFEKLKPVLAGYKAYFPDHWSGERYKWEAVQHFQDHWDIEAENFEEMFREATSKTFNLLASGYSYPRRMILRFARADGQAVRQMFRDLFDVNRDLAQRVRAFQRAAEILRAKYDDEGSWKNHYQNTNAISTYLWLKFPNQYYIYKYELAHNAAIELNSDYVPKRDGTVESMLIGYALYDELCAALRADPDIPQMIQTAAAEHGYSDPELKTAAIDLCFYLSRFYLEERSHPQKKAKDEQGSMLPSSCPASEPSQYWWLVASPKYWTFSELKVGEEVSYTLYNDNGNKRKIFQNFLDARVGDAVIGYEATPVKKIVALGRISKESDGEYIYIKKTEGLTTPIEYAALRGCPELEEMEFFHKANGSLFKLTKAEYDFIMDTVREGNPVTRKDHVHKYSKEDFLNEVYMMPERYDVLTQLVRSKGNVILQGAPGVGKTFMARRLAYAMMGVEDESRVKLVQFHQNYSYEDFVIGYRPDGAGFKLDEGIFPRFCRTASNHPGQNYFFLIDEINRGNLSKIFGELLMLIEKDYRGEKITLPGGTSFWVPDNLYIIGMMNTADRSLAMIDYALRRRFSFFEVEPGFSSDGFQTYQSGFANETFDALISQIKALNKEIAKDPSLGRGFRIGHSYFCGRGAGECTEDWMHSVVEFDILPTLEEYWFDEPAELQKWEKKLRGVFDDQ